jgi:hypothetical protein
MQVKTVAAKVEAGYFVSVALSTDHPLKAVGNRAAREKKN